MSIRQFFQMKSGTNVVIVGQPVETTFMDSNGQPYYACQLKNPVLVRCSVDKEVTPYETSEVFMRSVDLDDEKFAPKLVDETKPEEGWFVPTWVVDFSKGQEMALYQSETIAAWAKANRGARKIQRTSDINAKIAAKLNGIAPKKD